LGVEKEFIIDLGMDHTQTPITAHGFIDLIVEEDAETLEIIDYKTGNKTQNTKEVGADIQAQLYAYAVTQLYPEYQYYLVTMDYFKSSPITVSFDKNQLDATVNFVKSRWESIKKKTKLTRRDNDWVCKYLCNRELCDIEWNKLCSRKQN
jgi:ATP-dependent helicase/DNAse subunit B